jgi:hypothetical protein
MMSDNTATASPLAKGQLIEQTEGKIVLGLPGTEYQIHLLATAPVTASVTGKITGTITITAHRIDQTQKNTGGRFIEPVYGRPRRIQGRIIDTDVTANTITVLAACPVVCSFATAQSASDFQVGQFVTFDAEPGAKFAQA